MLDRRKEAASSEFLQDQRILIIGGTGSLGQVLLSRILDGEGGRPARIVLLSRDEAKQHQLRTRYETRGSDKRDLACANGAIEYRLGDVRDLHTVAAALRDIDIVIHAAALKQVPTCEYFPYEAVMTNVTGAENIARAIRAFGLPVKTVLGISTDKAVNPVNVMGMTKALQERILVRANLDLPNTRFAVVRYGNVLASRGSVIPLFRDQIRNGGPVTITHPDMTRFLLSLRDAVDTIFEALQDAREGEIYVPAIRGARVVDIAKVLIGPRMIPTECTGIRPGEKLHEVLISAEESRWTVRRGRHFVIHPILPELRGELPDPPALSSEYASNADIMGVDALRDLLVRSDLLSDTIALSRTGELLR